MSACSARRSWLFGLVVTLAWMAPGCQKGPTSSEERLKNAEESADEALKKLEAEQRTSAKLEGTVEGLYAGGLDAAREWDLVADIDLATSLLSDLQSSVNVGKYKEARPDAEALLDVLQCLKAELPAVRISLCVRRSVHYMRMASDLHAKGALLDAVSLATTPKKELQPLVPPVAKDLQDVQEALEEQGREKARELALAVLKKTDNTEEELLVDRCHASVVSARDALDREAEHVIVAELAQVNQLLKDLRYIAQTVRVASPSPPPAGTPPASPAPAETPPETESGAPSPTETGETPGEPAPSEGGTEPAAAPPESGI